MSLKLLYPLHSTGLSDAGKNMLFLIYIFGKSKSNHSLLNVWHGSDIITCIWLRTYISLLDDEELSDDDDVSLQMALEESAGYIKTTKNTSRFNRKRFFVFSLCVIVHFIFRFFRNVDPPPVLLDTKEILKSHCQKVLVSDEMYISTYTRRNYINVRRGHVLEDGINKSTEQHFNQTCQFQ